MKIEVKAYNSIALLISSIALFILGAVMFTNPNEMVVITTYILGGLIIIMGLFKSIKNYLDVKKDSSTSSVGMVSGVVLIVIGLIIIFLSGAIEFLVRFIIGGWILFSGINRLINALSLPKKDTSFWVLLGLALLLIGGGIYTVLSTNLLFKYLGLILMIFATLEIVGYIFSRKEIVKAFQEEEKVVEAVVTEVKEDIKELDNKDNKKKKSNKEEDEEESKK